MDQLNIQRQENNTFQGFKEAVTNFAPTYKYDQFCDDYDTSDKSRTPAWTDRVLWKHNPFIKHQNPDEEAVDEDLETWPKLLLYTRSELKTSDHRPVMGLFDVQVMSVKERERDQVFEEVLSVQGPQDATVIISSENGEFDDDLVDEIVGTFSEFGEIILVRFVDEDMWLIFKNGQMALEAVQQDKLEIAGKKISVRLKTANWKEINLLELRASSLQTEPLFNTTTNSLLGEDFEIADIDCYDSEGDDDDDDGEEEQEPLPEPLHPSRSASSSPHSGTQSPAEAMMLSGSNTSLEKAGVPPPRPQPASRSRPPPPAARPRETTPPQQQNIADTLIVPEQVSKVRGAAPEQSVNKPGPPQRPGPPAKPPPPQRPPGGPPRPSAGAPSKPPSSPQRPRKAVSGPPIKQPLGPQAIGKIKSKQQNKITRIGLPTNVTHMGHAKSPEEAAALIEKLLQSGGADMKGTLQAPLKPGLKPNQSNIPKSKTSDDIPLSADTVLQPPQGMQRVQSAENITTASSQPVPALRKDSLEGKEADEESKPRPAPRRNIQSCYIESNSGLSSAGPTTAPPPVVPRPQSMIDRGTLPAVPKALPETSQNYYSSVVDHSKIDAEKGQILLNGSNKSETVYEATEYETIWGAKTTNVGVVAPALPAVPKRRDLAPEGESLLDKPMSPNAKETKPDPFDTSAISQMLPTSIPLMPTQPAVINTDTSNYNMPAVPPRPVNDNALKTNSVFNEFDSLSNNFTPSEGAPSHPPPSLPMSRPQGMPPPPPPRNDSNMCNTEPMASAPLSAPPPVPARPPTDIPFTNQGAVPLDMPPVPARPAPPPPVPKRPTA